MALRELPPAVERRQVGCYDNVKSNRPANLITPFRRSLPMPTVNELYKAHEQLKRDGKNDEAIAQLEELLQQDDQHVLSHLALAVLYGKVEKHDLAVTHAEKAVEIEPQDTFNWTALSTTYQRAFEATRDRQYIFRAEDAKARAAQMQWQK
jgi:Tfp pilus assembly protein PilF